MHDHVNMDVTLAQIYYYIDLIAEQCKQSSTRKSYNLFDQKMTSEECKKNLDQKYDGDVSGD